MTNLNYIRVLPRSALERTTEYWPWDRPKCDSRKRSQWPHHQHQHSGCEPLPAQRQEWRWEDPVKKWKKAQNNNLATFKSKTFGQEQIGGSGLILYFNHHNQFLFFFLSYFFLLLCVLAWFFIFVWATQAPPQQLLNLSLLPAIGQWMATVALLVCHLLRQRAQVQLPESTSCLTTPPLFLTCSISRFLRDLFLCSL